MFKTTTEIPKYVADYQYIKSNGLHFKNYINDRIDDFQSGANSKTLEGVVVQLSRFINEYTSRKVTPGLVAFAEHVDGAGYNVVAEVEAVIAATKEVVDYIRGALPKDGNGYLLVEKIGAGGGREYRSFSASALAPAIALLTALADTLD